MSELFSSQTKIMEGLSRKLASNDKMLENINNRMAGFSLAIKYQHSFNKMIELQIAQLAAAVPSTDKGKILGQPEDLKTANLVDIHNVAGCYIEQSIGRWEDYSLPIKKEDLGRHHPHSHWTPHILRSCL